jgi:hypothetical protein
MVEVQPASGLGTPIYTGATGALTVQGPGVTFFPSSLTQGQTTPLTVTVTNLTGAPLQGLQVNACGQSLNPNFPSTLPTTLSSSQAANCTAVSTTNAQGSVTFSLSPSSASPIEIYVNLTDTNVSVPVYGGALSLTINNTSPKAGDTVTLTVKTAGSNPIAVPGATLTITRDGTAVTAPAIDNNGNAVLGNLSAGNYTVTATFATFTPAYLNFTVGATNGTVHVTGAHFTLSNLTVPEQINVGQPVSVSVDITNDGDATGSPTASLYVGPAGHENFITSIQVPDLAAGQTQPVQFQPYTPVVAGSYHVIVKIGTQATIDRTVTIGTPTTTTSTPTSSTETSTTSTSPTVSTTTSPTTATTTTSPTTSTSPVSPTTTTTTTTTTSPTPASPRVPGFEFVALIGAIGAALLVLRRKTN